MSFTSFTYIIIIVYTVVISYLNFFSFGFTIISTIRLDAYLKADKKIENQYTVISSNLYK